MTISLSLFHNSPPTPEVHLRPLRAALGAGGGAAAAGHGGHRAAGLLPLLQVRSGDQDLELRRGLRGLAPGPPLLGAGECEGGARGADHQHVAGSGPGQATNFCHKFGLLKQTPDTFLALSNVSLT